jgi:hypothetical protein
MTKKVMETIISSLLLGALTLAFNLTFSYFFIEKGTIRIGEPIQIGQNQFQISISLMNFSNKNINNLEIKLPLNVEANNIFVSQPIMINKINTNYGNNSGSVYQVSKLASHENITIAIITSNKIDANQVAINNNGNNVEVEYIDKVTSPLKKSIGTWTVNALIYAALFGLTNYITDRRRQKQISEYYDKWERNKKEIQEETERMSKRINDQEKERLKILEESEKLNQKIQKIHDTHMKWRVMYLSKLRDFSKELNFWRDTIRKITYKSSENKIDSNELINIVTNNLQTYQTKINAEENYETLKVMSKIFKDES